MVAARTRESAAARIERRCGVLAPGIHLGVPFANYAADPGVNNGVLGALNGAHLLHLIAEGRKDTPTLRKGRALHIAVLEPARFASAVVKRPNFGGKGARARAAAWNAEHAHREILTPGEYADVMGMADGILRHDGARKALADAAGASEATLIWEEQGIRCKARVDRLIPGRLALDVKTTADATPEEFAASAYSYGYHRQLAWYRRGVLACTGVDVPWTVIAVESEARGRDFNGVDVSHHLAAVYAPLGDLLQLGENDAVAGLARIKAILASNNWRGFPGEVQPLDLPEWVRRARRSELTN